MIASEYIKEAFNIYFKDMRKDTFKIMKYAKTRYWKRNAQLFGGVVIDEWRKIKKQN